MEQRVLLAQRNSGSKP